MFELSNLRICFVAGTLEHGGAERQLFYMLRALSQCGAATRVLCLDQGQFWEPAILSLGVPVTWVGQSKSRMRRLARIIRQLRSDPPDLVQSQHFFANAYVGLSARLLRVLGIGAMRNEGPADIMKNGRVGGWLHLNLPRVIAANSQGAIQYGIARGLSADRFHFLPNVVDTWHFKPGSRTGERPLTLLSVGRIVTEKRFDRFIAVLGRLRKELHLDVRGWIAGPSQDKELQRSLEAQATQLGLYPKYLQFLGGVSSMSSLYQEADIFVLASDCEGTPNVVLEAMASGLPVVATNVGGVPDIVVAGETGFVLGREDLEGMISALAELIKNEDRRTQMGRRAREHVQDHHSLERLPGYLTRLYQAVLPNPFPGRLGLVEGIS